jgi:hypothetical protein
MLEFEILTPAAAARWDAFVATHPAATVFHLAGWAKVMRQAYGHKSHFTLATEGGTVKGVIPLVELKSRLFGHALISNAFCVGGGPLAIDEPTRLALINEAGRIGRTTGASYVELRDTPGAEGWRSKDDLYAGFEREMDTDEAKNLLQIPRKQRAVVRKAIEGPFRVTTDKDVDTFFALFARTVPITARPFSQSAISRQSSTLFQTTPTYSRSGKTTNRFQASSLTTSVIAYILTIRAATLQRARPAPTI